MLHITNGESVINTFREMNLPGEYLSWMDVLVEGPVPASESLEALSEIRARFVAACGWSTEEEARASFRDRDVQLCSSREHDEVVLWFEHDLHDQLQLLQVLDWYHMNPPLPPILKMLHLQGYLGSAPAELLEIVHGLRQNVHPLQLELAHRGWSAFTASAPAQMLELLVVDPEAEDDPLRPLPYLRRNFVRLLSDYPSTRNGLARTSQLLLEALMPAPLSRMDLFPAYSARENAIFLGDWSVWRRLDELAHGGAITAQEPHQLTDFGRKLLEGSADWVRGRGIDAWIGGVHLVGDDSPWRWDEERQTLVGC